MGSKSKQPAARLTDIGSNHGPWPPTPIIAGSGNVLICSLPAARQGDAVLLHVIPNNPPHPRSIAEGSGSVLINGIPAARVSDAISCGGKVATGAGNVMIGDQPEKARNSKVQLEFEELLQKRISDPKTRRYTPYQQTQLAADTAVKYRGEQGAVDTWHDHYMSNNPTTPPASAAEAKGLQQAQAEKAKTAKEDAQTAQQIADSEQKQSVLQPLTEIMVDAVAQLAQGELATPAMEAVTAKMLDAAGANGEGVVDAAKTVNAFVDSAENSDGGAINEPLQVAAKKLASAAGAPFCEECAKGAS